MGIDDRDYMRERYRRRVGQTKWNDGRSRIEAAWRDPRHPFHRRRHRQNAIGRVGVRLVLPLLSALLILIPLYGEAQRRGWIPDIEQAQPFPETGSVTVAGNIVGLTAHSRLTIVTADANAVVQLVEPDASRHVLSIYVAGNDRVTLPVPVGTYRVQLIEGKKWHGPKRYFGPNTSYETVTEPMTFGPRAGHIIDLHRRPDGNLKTRLMMSGPAPL